MATSWIGETSLNYLSLIALMYQIIVYSKKTRLVFEPRVVIEWIFWIVFRRIEKFWAQDELISGMCYACSVRFSIEHVANFINTSDFLA